MPGARPLRQTDKDSAGTAQQDGHHQLPRLHLTQMQNGLHYLLAIHFLSELVRIPLYYRTSMNEKKQTLPVRWGTLSNHQNSRG